jgi:DNA-binding MarR family transcriptional regulator
LAEALHLDASTVTRQVTALVGSGLVARRPNPSDGRSSTLSLTSEGRRTMREVEHERQRVLREIFGDWGEAERADAARVLTKFNGSLVDKFAGSGVSE